MVDSGGVDQAEHVADHAGKLFLDQHGDPGADDTARFYHHTGIISGDEARMITILVARFLQIRVRANKWPGRRVGDALHRVLRTMGDIEDNAQLVHPPHNERTESRHVAMCWPRGLDGALLVYA